MRDKLTTAAEIVGSALVVAGIAMVWVPAAVIVSGAALIGFSSRLSR